MTGVIRVMFVQNISSLLTMSIVTWRLKGAIISRLLFSVWLVRPMATKQGPTGQVKQWGRHVMAPRAITQQNMAISPMGLGIMNHWAGDRKQQSGRVSCVGQLQSWVESWQFSSLVVRQSPVSRDASRGHCWDLIPGNVQLNTEDLVCSVVISSMCELVRVLQLLVLTIYKCSVNPITNPNHMSSH
jgi:hypothetical protein